MARHRKVGLDPSSLEPIVEKTASLREIMRDARHLPIGKVHPNPDQPRKTFDPTADEDLKRSIQDVGIIEPLVVRPYGEGYQLICGERRYRAASALGLASVPAIIRKADDLTALRLAYQENIQREDLPILDEARFLQALITRGLVKTRQQLASSLGISKGRVTQKLTVLGLPPKFQEAFAVYPFLGELHARVLSQIDEEQARERLLSSIVTRQLSGRQSEVLAQRYISRSTGARTKARSTSFNNATVHRDRSRYVFRLPILPLDELSDLLDNLAKAVRTRELTLPPPIKSDPHS